MKLVSLKSALLESSSNTSTRRRGLKGHQLRLKRENPELFSELTAHNVSDIIQMDHSRMNEPQNAKLKSLRREMKTHWNYWVQNASNEFDEFWHGIDSPILAVHWVNLLETTSEEKSLQRLNQYIERNKNSENKHDLSCIGYMEFGSSPWDDNNGNWNLESIRKIPVQSPIGLVMNRRTVNWATYSDAWTEFISSAGEKELEHYKSSGLPKRPSLKISPDFVIFGPEDMNLGNIISELIVSNYAWDLVIISKIYCRTTGLNVDKIKAMLDQYKINYIIR
tara:strand:+ start:354 stop:1190 length:837 start_codon:yes stop_codon:yes gene_type:complete